MAVRGKSGGDKKKPPIKVYRPPKHTKAVRQFDLAPDQAIGRRVGNMTQKEREIHFQMSGVRPKKQPKRQADTRGLATLEIKKIQAKKAAAELPIEFKTVARENESLEKYEHRVRMEQLRIQQGMGDYKRKTSEGKLQYKRERRAQKQEKKAHRLKEDEKDQDFTGRSEHIAFGEVVERPPSFADMVLPGETLALTGSQKKQPETNLEKLQRALKNANTSVKSQFDSMQHGSGFGDDNDGDNNNDDEDNIDDPRKREIIAQQKNQKRKEREALLKVAREKQRQVDLEKAKLQAQAAYQQLKNKRGGDSSGGKVNMGTLTASTQIIYQAGVKAMRDLHSVDGRVYHHGK